ncbi:hypothetical protein BASH2_01405 [Bacillus anthracis]|nr:hypothetical protein BASH2_01405 [Bacillus anthracis]
MTKFFFIRYTTSRQKVGEEYGTNFMGSIFYDAKPFAIFT